jgi:hypothetical protein
MVELVLILAVIHLNVNVMLDFLGRYVRLTLILVHLYHVSMEEDARQ